MTSSEASIAGFWRATLPADGARWLCAQRLPRWIAGGWALDLFARTKRRAHRDLDIGILRRDAHTVIASRPLWEFFEAKDGRLRRLGNGSPQRADVNSLWCRQAGAAQWLTESMLDASDGDCWAFRRLPTIRRPLATVM